MHSVCIVCCIVYCTPVDQPTPQLVRLFFFYIFFITIIILFLWIRQFLFYTRTHERRRENNTSIAEGNLYRTCLWIALHKQKPVGSLAPRKFSIHIFFTYELYVHFFLASILKFSTTLFVGGGIIQQQCSCNSSSSRINSSYSKNNNNENPKVRAQQRHKDAFFGIHWYAYGNALSITCMQTRRQKMLDTLDELVKKLTFIL